MAWFCADDVQERAQLLQGKWQDTTANPSLYTITASKAPTGGAIFSLHTMRAAGYEQSDHRNAPVVRVEFAEEEPCGGDEEHGGGGRARIVWGKDVAKYEAIIEPETIAWRPLIQSTKGCFIWKREGARGAALLEAPPPSATPSGNGHRRRARTGGAGTRGGASHAPPPQAVPLPLLLLRLPPGLVDNYGRRL